jgi:hypothetical protein
MNLTEAFHPPPEPVLHKTGSIICVVLGIRFSNIFCNKSLHAAYRSGEHKHIENGIILTYSFAHGTHWAKKGFTVIFRLHIYLI